MSMDERNRAELRALFARLDDLCVLRDKGIMRSTDFLSPRELYHASAYLDKMGTLYRVFGGYEGAERCRVYLLPDYMEGVLEDGKRELDELLDELGEDTDTVALRMSGSGYRTLTHRDFLGSLLAMGIDRAALGDILVDLDGFGATVFCGRAIAELVEHESCRIANDKVSVRRLGKGEITVPERRFAKINDTVASARLDCVVASLCSLSRERARETVISGIVEMNFESEDRPDRTVIAPATVSVRGYGRFRVLSVSEQTRKGRYRLEAVKYL